jgi:hypothetical protein
VLGRVSRILSVIWSILLTITMLTTGSNVSTLIQHSIASNGWFGEEGEHMIGHGALKGELRSR